MKFMLLVLVNVILYQHAEADLPCPNQAITQSLIDTILETAKFQYGVTFQWNCELSAQALTVSSQCSLENSGSTSGQLKFSVQKDASKTTDQLVENHFVFIRSSLENGQLTASGSSNSNAQALFGCGFQDCSSRIDIVCLSIGYATVISTMLLVTIALLFIVFFTGGQGSNVEEGSAQDDNLLERVNTVVVEDNGLDAESSLVENLLTSGDTDVDCPSSGISDEWKELILNTHNDHRSRLAFGKEPNKRGLMQTGRNIYKLFWDCELESQVQSHIVNCSSKFIEPEQLKSRSQLIKTLWLDWTGRNHTGNIIKAMDAWWSQGRIFGNEDLGNRFVPGKNYFGWANMAKGKSTSIGCAYQVCEDQEKAVFSCVYNEKAQCYDEMIYEPGLACEQDDDCFTYPNSKCLPAEGLCIAPPKVVVDNSSEICPGNTKVSDATRRAALAQHNFYRSRLARSLEFNGETNATQAPARRMLKMEYDCELEEYAQKWAENCVFAHSQHHERPNQGQNLYMTSFQFSDHHNLIHTGVEKWWQELEEFGVPKENMITRKMWQDKGHAVGHWTQMAWDRSYRLGCAVVNCPDMGFVVCHYGPAGNRHGQLIYEMGNPCSSDEECPRDFECVVEEGLCARSTLEKK